MRTRHRCRRDRRPPDNLASWTGESRRAPPRSLVWHYPHYNEHPSSLPSSVIRKGRWKLIETFDPPGVELYDLERDLGETTDRSTTEPDVVRELRSELEAWRASVGAERMLPNPDYEPADGAGTKNQRKRRS